MNVLFPDVIADPQFCNAEEARVNVESALRRPLPYLNLFPGNPYSWKAIIIGLGPSAADKFPEIDARTDGIKVLGANAQRLIYPSVKDNVTFPPKLLNGADIVVYNIPGAGYAPSIKPGHPELEYWLASRCDPTLFDKALSLNSPVKMYDADELTSSGHPAIGVGSTGPTAAVALLLARGHRDFEFYGVDGGDFVNEPNSYLTCDMRDVIDDPVFVTNFTGHVMIGLGDRVMKVANNYWSQAQQMNALIRSPEGQKAKFRFHGEETLNNLLFNQGIIPKILYRSSPPGPAEGAPTLSN